MLEFKSVTFPIFLS